MSTKKTSLQVFSTNYDFYINRLRDLMFSQKTSLHYTKDSFNLELLVFHYKNESYKNFNYIYYVIVNDLINCLYYDLLELKKIVNKCSDSHSLLFVCYLLLCGKYTISISSKLYEEVSK